MTASAPGAVIVTGAGRGIGASTAMLAASKGYPVCVNYHRDVSAAERVAGAITDSGGRAIAVSADIRDESGVRRMFDVAERELGRLHALVNNAAILEKQSSFEGISGDRLERILRSNVAGAFLCTKEAARRLSTRNGGSGGAIVNISSIAARTGAAFEYVDYAASKGALDTLTAGLARELAPQGIRVNLVRPGFIHTDMHAAGGEPGRVDRLAPKIPLQRGGEPEEVARAIVWLLSDAACYVVGTSIDVAGGA